MVDLRALSIDQSCHAAYRGVYSACVRICVSACMQVEILIFRFPFAQTEQHVASPGVTATFAMEQHQRQGSDQRPRLLTRFRPITPRTASQTQPLRPLTTSLRAQGEQIAAAFPDLPLNVIFHDLAITRIPEVTVENILAGRISRNIDEGAIRFEYETSNQIAQRNTSQVKSLVAQ